MLPVSEPGQIAVIDGCSLSLRALLLLGLEQA
jgi:hypothetical protein